MVLHLPLNGNGDDLTGQSQVDVVGTRPADDRVKRPGRALEFDGDNDLLSISSPDALNFDLRRDDYTLSLWVLSPGTDRARILQKWDEDLKTPYAFSIQAIPEALVVAVYDGNRLYRIDVEAIWDGGWHHVAVRVDANSERLAVFLDGSLWADREVSIQSSTQNSASVQFGGTDQLEGTGLSRSFRGVLDEIRVYSRPLSTTEIATLANS